MFVIEVKQEDKRWITGVFKNERDAEFYLNEVPDKLKQFLVLHETDLQFPFFILERNGFEFIDASQIIKRLDMTKRNDLDDAVHFNIYKIDKQFSPLKPGSDEMGLLKHIHIDNDFLRLYQRYGIDLLKRRHLM